MTDRLRVLAYCGVTVVIGLLVLQLLRWTVSPRIGDLPFPVVESAVLLSGAGMLGVLRRLL